MSEAPEIPGTDSWWPESVAALCEELAQRMDEGETGTPRIDFLWNTLFILGSDGNARTPENLPPDAEEMYERRVRENLTEEDLQIIYNCLEAAALDDLSDDAWAVLMRLNGITGEQAQIIAGLLMQREATEGETGLN